MFDVDRVGVVGDPLAGEREYSQGGGLPLPQQVLGGEEDLGTAGGALGHLLAGDQGGQQ